MFNDFRQCQEYFKTYDPQLRAVRLSKVCHLDVHRDRKSNICCIEKNKLEIKFPETKTGLCYRL